MFGVAPTYLAVWYRNPVHTDVHHILVSWQRSVTASRSKIRIQCPSAHSSLLIVNLTVEVFTLV